MGRFGGTGKRKNRYDVTLLINGLPLAQIELKRRGAELKVAFHQVNRYQHDSYDAGAGLFQYVQLFIISNGVNTKYFANNKQQSFKQTFYWTDKENKRLSDLHEFSADFLKPCHIAKMMTHYMVMTEEQVIKVLRPYQFYATEELVDRVKNSNDNAYTRAICQRMPWALRRVSMPIVICHSVATMPLSRRVPSSITC